MWWEADGLSWPSRGPQIQFWGPAWHSSLLARVPLCWGKVRMLVGSRWSVWAPSIQKNSCWSFPVSPSPFRWRVNLQTKNSIPTPRFPTLHNSSPLQWRPSVEVRALSLLRTTEDHDPQSAELCSRFWPECEPPVRFYVWRVLTARIS